MANFPVPPQPSSAQETIRVEFRHSAFVAARALHPCLLTAYEESLLFGIVCRSRKGQAGRLCVPVSGEHKVEQEFSGWTRHCLFCICLTVTVLS